MRYNLTSQVFFQLLAWVLDAKYPGCWALPPPENVPDFWHCCIRFESRHRNRDTIKKRVMSVPIFTHSRVYYLGLRALLIMSISTLLCRRRSSRATDANRGRGTPVWSWFEEVFLPFESLNQSISDASSDFKEVECSKQSTRSLVMTDDFEQASMRLAWLLLLGCTSRNCPNRSHSKTRYL